MPADPLPILNIAAYKFAPLTGLAELRIELRDLAKAQRLRGTILLSPEGINCFVAGERPGIEALLERVRRIPGLADLPVKESLSREQPFNRMLVKIKAEIIAFGMPGIEPGRYTSRRLSPRELKRWLDEGRPVTLLDTRNEFEVDAGTFEGAVALPLDDFRHFPQAVLGLPAELKRQPVVTFCTGGIRCEKAAPYLEQAGFADVYQLDGGILKYFEECGGAHDPGGLLRLRPAGFRAAGSVGRGSRTVLRLPGDSHPRRSGITRVRRGDLVSALLSGGRRGAGGAACRAAGGPSGGDIPPARQRAV